MEDIKNEISKIKGKLQANIDLHKNGIKDLIEGDDNIKECTSLQEAHNSAAFRRFVSKALYNTAENLKKQGHKIDDDLVSSPEYWEENVLTPLIFTGYIDVSSTNFHTIQNVIHETISSPQVHTYYDKILKRAVHIKGGKVINHDKGSSDSIIRDSGEISIVKILSELQTLGRDANNIYMPHQRGEDIVTEISPSNGTLKDHVLADGFYNTNHNIIFDDEMKDRVDQTTEMSLSKYKKKKEAKIKNTSKRPYRQKQVNEAEIKKDITKKIGELGITLPIKRVNTRDDVVADKNTLKVISFCMQQFYLLSESPIKKDIDLKPIEFREQYITDNVERWEDTTDKKSKINGHLLTIADKFIDNLDEKWFDNKISRYDNDTLNIIEDILLGNSSFDHKMGSIIIRNILLTFKKHNPAKKNLSKGIDDTNLKSAD